MVFFLPFSGHALTSQTTRNAIQGSAPYLTFDGGRTRAVDTNGLLGITLSNGANYTPSNNSSSATPIVLPVEGQSFADIRMFVPTDTDSVALSTLIGPPNNYWGDDDGDSGVTATGRLSLSIVDKNNESVSRSTVPTICKAPYKVTLSSTNGTLSTRYGFPNRSTFSASDVTYYVNPKASPVVCFARPNLFPGKLGDDSRNPSIDFAGPSSMWDPANGFIPQSTDPLLYGRNFPTTGSDGLYFDLIIGGVNQPLSWSSISRGDITVKMSNSTATSVRVTLTNYIGIPTTLPQTFELVGRDNNGTPVVKYGFTLKQWFIKRTQNTYTYPETLSWCNSTGYRVPRVSDLTNSNYNNLGATPSSSGNYYQRRIGSGFFAEWGFLRIYSGANFNYDIPWTSDAVRSRQFFVNVYGFVYLSDFRYGLVLCAYP
ncbi:hypothetical protein [Gilliamella sp. B3367]|uniref:hypothetical protein n=1 Tax=Gilliamella sp. B3367 TaxID=2817989 RepID=UPI002269BCFC|nr:hypothetical protein [Gilliamella sp. B3367]MCX8594957.1 hypothetical protein [Gilliamella sp. B3367]